ncbi:hypothetical protein HDU82_007674 [Entophlyctis luteolus]|nr:hypothetical protein HDU82_007674 [Entophlyctis luteolus]
MHTGKAIDKLGLDLDNGAFSWQITMYAQARADAFSERFRPPLPQKDACEGPTDLRESEDVFHRQFISLQTSLMDSVDRQVEAIQGKLNENDIELARVVDEKKAIGVNLHKANMHVGKLNDKLFSASENETKLLHRCRDLEAEKDALKAELKSMADMNLNLVSNLNTVKSHLEEATDKNVKLTDLNTAYNSDLKIHRRMEGKVKKELLYVDQRRKVAEIDLEEHKRTIEKLVQNKNETDLIMEAQKQETSIANQTIAKLHQGLNILTLIIIKLGAPLKEIATMKAAKSKIEKQWEESFTAMSKRDSTFQSVENQKQQIKEDFEEAIMINRSLKSELEETHKRLSMKDLECKTLEDKVQFLQNSIRVTELKQQETRGSLVEAQVAESLYKQELDKIAKEELERKSSAVSELKGKIEALKADFDEKMRNEVIFLAAKKEEQVKLQAQAEIESKKREEFGKNTELRHANAELHLQLHQKQEQLKDLQNENKVLQRSYNDINTHYNKLYDEARHLMYDLERKEHDVNYLKSKMQGQTESDTAIPLKVELEKMQKESAAIKIENDNIQKMWLEAQKEISKGKAEIKRILDDNIYLRTQLGITDTIKIKTSEEIERARSKEYEHKMEYSRLQSEFRKLQPIVNEYRQKTLELEQKLTEAKDAIKQEHENALTATMMLKTEIRRLQEEKKEEKRNNLQEERSFQALERKYILVREMVAKLKRERTELQRTCFEFKMKFDEMEKMYFNSQLAAKRMSEKAGQTVGEIVTRLSSNTKTCAAAHQESSSGDSSIVLIQPQLDNTSVLQSVKLPPPIWASLATTPRQSTSAKTEALPTENTDVSSSVHESSSLSYRSDPPDFAAWKLKFESLTTERTFLIHENGILKQRIDELGMKISKLERSNKESAAHVASLENDLSSSENQVKTLFARCTKSERIAASIEKQFKEAKPNIKIDYSSVIEAEPSTQLIAALMCPDASSIQKKDRGLTYKAARIPPIMKTVLN